MGLVDTYLPLLTEFLGPFGTYRKDSHWKVPSFAVATASMYTSRIASANGVVDIQPGGWLYGIDPMFNTADGVYNETYFVDEGVLSFEVPTLRVEAGLYFVLAVQPVLTVIAFLVTIVLYGVPINRGFGMVSVLAGVEKESLALLRGAAFSGTVDRDIGMKVRLQTWERAVDTGKVSYTLGASGCNGKVKRKYRYA
jgi:hypothetical protein